MQHIEFLHIAHFKERYHRKKAPRSLSPYIDFFWETDFNVLFEQHPQGFSDALFANVGYTYLINLGTPFIMQLGTESRVVRKDAFLPRHKPLVCYHSRGNKIFGIKFNVSPVVFEKKVNFGDYRDRLFPLSYLIQSAVLRDIKAAKSFEERVHIAGSHYRQILQDHMGSLQYIHIVTDILNHYNSGAGDSTVQDLAHRYKISTRTLQRYFLAATSISAKNALQIIRIRRAVGAILQNPKAFDATRYGYYDYSHFYKEAKSFLFPYRMQNLLGAQKQV